MPKKNGVSYKVSRNGSADDWYWEVISDRNIIARGLAPTRVRARAEAMKAAASQHRAAAPLRRVAGYNATLKSTTPRSSTTEM